MRPADRPAGRAATPVPSAPLLPVVPSPLGVGLWIVALATVALILFLAPVSGVLAMAALSAGALLAWLVWQHPELMLIALVFIVTGLVPAALVDLRLPIGGLDLRDLCLLGLLGLLGLRQLVRGRPLIPWPPVSAPLIVFLVLALGSTVYALRFQGVATNWVFNELRILVYYTTFFVVAWAITRPRQLAVLLVGIFVVADLISLIIILQQFSGMGAPIIAAMAAGSGWYIVEQGGAGFGAVRIVPPGQVLLVMAVVLAFCLMLYEGQRPRLRAALAAQFVFLNVGLLLTYTRGQWIASALALALSALFLSPADKARLARYGLGVLVAALLLYGAFGSSLGQSSGGFFTMLGERFASMFTPRATIESASLQWRIFENEEALEAVAAHPLLGVGLGNAYRDISLTQGEARGWWGTLASGTYGRYTRYIHNSYLYVAAKLGLTGLLALLWFGAAYLFKGFQVLVSLREGQLKRIVLALLATFVSLLPWSMTQAHLMQIESTMTIGLMAGLVAAIDQMRQQEGAEPAYITRTG